MAEEMSGAPRPVRVVIVDDDPLVRSALRMMLGGRDDMFVIGEGSDPRSGVDAAIRLGADVVLMDLNLESDRDGIWATAQLAEKAPGVAVVVLTALNTDDRILEALRAGATSFLLKDASPEEIVGAVLGASQGQPRFSPYVMQRLVESAVSSEQPPIGHFPTDVTAREKEVAALVAEGLTNAEIADRMGVGPATVKTHVTALLNKFGVSNRVQLAINVLWTRTHPEA